MSTEHWHSNYSIVSPELKEAWGNWLTGLADWEWWVTLTFTDRVGDWAANQRWRYWLKKLQRDTGRVDFVRCTEYQDWRGVPHYHSLITGVGSQRRLYWMDYWQRIAGWARIKGYERSLGAQFYLCKYTTKELGDIKFSRGLTRYQNGGKLSAGE